MCRVVSIFAGRHLVCKQRRDVFVTVCPDGNVIFNGKVMTMIQATEEAKVMCGCDSNERFCWVMEV